MNFKSWRQVTCVAWRWFKHSCKYWDKSCAKMGGRQSFCNRLYFWRHIGLVLLGKKYAFNKQAFMWWGQGFPYWGRCRGGIPPPTKNSLINPPPPEPGKVPPSRLSPPLPNFYSLPTKSQSPPPTKKNNPIKTSYLAVVTALVPFCFNFIFFWLTGHANFDFNWCSILTECCFQLCKRFESSKSLLLRFSTSSENSRGCDRELEEKVIGNKMC